MKMTLSPITDMTSCPQALIEHLRKQNKEENWADADVTQNTKKVFFAIESSQEQWRDWGGIMGWFVPFLLPWDKQQLESSSTAQYLEQTIPSDCIKCSKTRLNEQTRDEGFMSLDLARKKMGVDDVASFHSSFIMAFKSSVILSSKTI